MSKILAIAGGGAAGYFAAINVAAINPSWKVILLEKSSKVLQKVKVSGGGRCNVTHSCFDPVALITNYPRGARELLGPFNRFQPSDTIEWFRSRGVELKTESDGRMFPVSNSSQTIIDCFTTEASRLKVELQLQTGIKSITIKEGNEKKFQITNTNDELLNVDALLMATGSSNSMWQLMQEMGHKIVDPVPSLFTFNIADDRIKDLQGLSVPSAEVGIAGSKFRTNGPVLITHWGLSGPAVLKMSALAARELHAKDYQYDVDINWIGGMTAARLEEEFFRIRKSSPARIVKTQSFDEIPLRLWNALIPGPVLNKRWADLRNEEVTTMIHAIVHCSMKANGKSTFKEEFVTAGGIDLKEVDFRTMESKLIPGLYFAGEILNIDAVTGGFNFQAAWTEAFIAAQSIAGS